MTYDTRERVLTLFEIVSDRFEQRSGPCKRLDPVTGNVIESIPIPTFDPERKQRKVEFLRRKKSAGDCA